MSEGGGSGGGKGQEGGRDRRGESREGEGVGAGGDRGGMAEGREGKLYDGYICSLPWLSLNRGSNFPGYAVHSIFHDKLSPPGSCHGNSTVSIDIIFSSL